MAEQTDKTESKDAGSIDYTKSQADVDKAKQKARDQDAERLAAEHE